MINIHQSVTVDDLYELFGLRSTNYLRKNHQIEMDQFNNVDQPFACATVPVFAHVFEELLQLRDIDNYPLVHDNFLVIKMSESPLRKSNHHSYPPLQFPSIQWITHT